MSCASRCIRRQVCNRARAYTLGGVLDDGLVDGLSESAFFSSLGPRMVIGDRDGGTINTCS